MTHKRLYFIDNVRTLLIALVIMVHAAVTYGGEGGWYFEEASDSMVAIVLLTMFNAICQSFFMSLLFLIAGYFTADSFAKTSMSRYLMARLNRLGIPLLSFYLGVGPLTIYLSGNLDGSIFNYRQSFHAGPMWFAQALLIFTGIFVICTLLRKAMVSTEMKRILVYVLPVWLPILMFILLLWMTTIPVRALWPMGEGVWGMQLGSFAQYGFMFVVGVLIYGTDWSGWLVRVSMVKVSALVVLGLLILPVVMLLGVDDEMGFDYFMGGFSWQAMLYAAWESSMCVMLSLWVVKSVQKASVIDTPMLQKMGRANYAVYILHAPILVMVSGVLLPLSWHPLVKFIVASAMTIAVCFPMGYGLTQLPVLRKIL